MTAASRVDLGAVAAMLSVAAQYATPASYLSPRSVPPEWVGGVIADRRRWYADPCDPKREYAVDLASLRGAIALATQRRDPWHRLACDTLSAVVAETVAEEDRQTGRQRTYADAFAWAETLVPESTEDNPGATYCPTCADVRAELDRARGRIMTQMRGDLAPSEVLAAVAILFPSWSVSLVEMDGAWEASVLPAYWPRGRASRRASADEAAAEVLASVRAHLGNGDRLAIDGIPGAKP